VVVSNIHLGRYGYGHLAARDAPICARDFQRWPAPRCLRAGRVCQYEDSTDGDFILDRHPEAENVWIVGGGSGPGYKHRPVMGEMVAIALLGLKAPPAVLLISFPLKSSNERQPRRDAVMCVPLKCDEVFVELTQATSPSALLEQPVLRERQVPRGRALMTSAND
jgi:hypothetical protein